MSHAHRNLFGLLSLIDERHLKKPETHSRNPIACCWPYGLVLMSVMAWVLEIVLLARSMSCDHNCGKSDGGLREIWPNYAV